MENIYQNFEKAKKVLDDRAMHIARIAFNIDNSFEHSFDLIPRMRDFTARLICYTEDTYPANPNYDPKADHSLPENKEKQTGFSWLHVQVPKAIIRITEIVDSYDDCDPEEAQFQIPQELALCGSDEKLKLWFEDYFSSEIDRQMKLKNEAKYNLLFDLDLSVVDKILNHKEFSDNDSLDYKTRNKILLECGVNVFNRK